MPLRRIALLSYTPGFVRVFRVPNLTIAWYAPTPHNKRRLARLARTLVRRGAKVLRHAAGPGYMIDTRPLYGIEGTG